jgi:hypothetical protein
MQTRRCWMSFSRWFKHRSLVSKSSYQHLISLKHVAVEFLVWSLDPSAVFVSSTLFVLQLADMQFIVLVWITLREIGHYII